MAPHQRDVEASDEGDHDEAEERQRHHGRRQVQRDGGEQQQEASTQNKASVAYNILNEPRHIWKDMTGQQVRGHRRRRRADPALRAAQGVRRRAEYVRRSRATPSPSHASSKPVLAVSGKPLETRETVPYVSVVTRAASFVDLVEGNMVAVVTAEPASSIEPSGMAFIRPARDRRR